MKEKMSNEYADYLNLSRICNNIQSQYGVESDQFHKAHYECSKAQKKWYDMCLGRLNKQSGKKRTALYEAIIDVAKCELVEACEYSPQKIEMLFND